MMPEIRDLLFDELRNYIAREVLPLWPTPLRKGGSWQPISATDSYKSGWCSEGHLKVIRLQSLGLYDIKNSVSCCTYCLLLIITILLGMCFVN